MLNDLLTKQGNFLFRWRSYLPVLMIVPLAIATMNMNWPMGSHVYHEIVEFVCLLLSLLGLAIRVLTIGHTPKGTSGRNTAKQAAAVLNTTGVYSLVRHPLYLGNYMIGLGLMLLPLVWWLPLIYTLAFALYYERIMLAEEAFLQSKFGTRYTEWAETTPAFLPRLHGWKKPSLPFSLRNVLKREYTALGQICVGFFFVEIIEHIVIEHRVVVEPVWIFIATLGAVQYLVLRTLKRRTTLLEVTGR
ncbi:methyltransferase family protein [Pirellulaceae bacterium SH501]